MCARKGITGATAVQSVNNLMVWLDILLLMGGADNRSARVMNNDGIQTTMYHRILLPMYRDALVPQH